MIRFWLIVFISYTWLLEKLKNVLKNRLILWFVKRIFISLFESQFVFISLF